LPAAPSVLRRRVAAAQAGLLVVIGTLLGVFGGITPAAWMVTFRPDRERHVPWLPLAITVLFTPAFSGAATAVGGPGARDAGVVIHDRAGFDRD
jgi:hypothetical protein